MNEIRIFERIAENVTEDLMAVMQSRDEGPTQFGLRLQEAVGGKKA